MKILTLTTALMVALATPVLATGTGTKTDDQPVLTVVASHSGPGESLAERIHAQLAAESRGDD